MQSLTHEDPDAKHLRHHRHTYLCTNKVQPTTKDGG